MNKDRLPGGTMQSSPHGETEETEESFFSEEHWKMDKGI